MRCRSTRKQTCRVSPTSISRRGRLPGLDLLYPGLAPTGPLPESVDFALIRSKEPRRFDAVLFTDPQPESNAEIDFIRDDVVAGLNGIEAAFGITAGDIMFDELSLYRALQRNYRPDRPSLVEHRRQS